MSRTVLDRKELLIKVKRGHKQAVLTPRGRCDAEEGSTAVHTTGAMLPLEQPLNIHDHSQPQNVTSFGTRVLAHVTG